LFLVNGGIAGATLACIPALHARLVAGLTFDVSQLRGSDGVSALRYP
jgi:hypothetical protein